MALRCSKFPENTGRKLAGFMLRCNACYLAKNNKINKRTPAAARNWGGVCIAADSLITAFGTL
jgi:hypothetical protein